MGEKLSYKRLKELVGKEIGLSDWMAISQDRINAFAECTEDRQWIHVDVDRAKKGPLKGTVAHSFLILSLLPHFLYQNTRFASGVKMAVNYGLNRVRFLSPVRTGARIRNRAVLKEVSKRGFRKVLLCTENTVEVEEQDKPCLVAEFLVLLYI